MYSAVCPRYSSRKETTSVNVGLSESWSSQHDSIMENLQLNDDTLMRVKHLLQHTWGEKNKDGGRTSRSDKFVALE